MLWLSTFPSPMTLTLDFQGQILKCCMSGMQRPIDMEQRGCASIGCHTHFVTFHFYFNHDLDLRFSRLNFEEVVSGMGWPIDMEWKGCESIECWTHVVTFNIPLTHDIDLGFSRSNIENVVSQEWQNRLTWNDRDVRRYDITPTLWLSTLTSTMTLTLGFQGQILEKLYHVWDGWLSWN